MSGTVNSGDFLTVWIFIESRRQAGQPYIFAIVIKCLSGRSARTVAGRWLGVVAVSSRTKPSSFRSQGCLVHHRKYMDRNEIGCQRWYLNLRQWRSRP